MIRPAERRRHPGAHPAAIAGAIALLLGGADAATGAAVAAATASKDSARPTGRWSVAAADKAAPPPAAAADRKAAAPAGGDGAEATPPPARPPAAAPDLDKLRAEYDRIREELFKARVRSQKVSETAYPSRLDVHMRWKGGPDFVIRKARMLLDGSELWDSGDRAQTDDVIDVSERSVKPGPHAFTVRLEIRPKAEAKGGTKTGADKVGYTSEHTFAIVVADSGKTHLELTGDEDGDPPEYEPELELEIENEK